MFDLEPAAREVARLATSTGDDQLAAPTPCEHTPVAGMLDHLMGLSLAFRDAASESAGSAGSQPSASADNLAADWRDQLPVRLGELAAAWRDPSAWEGMATAGGVEMPAEVMGTVVINELVIHGWDLARSTGQDFESDEQSVAASLAFTTQMAEPGQSRDGLFGPIVEVPPVALRPWTARWGSAAGTPAGRQQPSTRNGRTRYRATRQSATRGTVTTDRPLIPAKSAGLRV